MQAAAGSRRSSGKRRSSSKRRVSEQQRMMMSVNGGDIHTRDRGNSNSSNGSDFDIDDLIFGEDEEFDFEIQRLSSFDDPDDLDDDLSVDGVSPFVTGSEGNRNNISERNIFPVGSTALTGNLSRDSTMSNDSSTSNNSDSLLDDEPSDDSDDDALLDNDSDDSNSNSDSDDDNGFFVSHVTGKDDSESEDDNERRNSQLLDNDEDRISFIQMIVVAPIM